MPRHLIQKKPIQLTHKTTTLKTNTKLYLWTLNYKFFNDECTHFFYSKNENHFLNRFLKMLILFKTNNYNRNISFITEKVSKWCW